ncbi:MAG TPA: hypothetical protein VHJ79_17620 [Mycobacterium sp.]|nr:hypothetical protein [Mycobacterium sp.]
MAWVARVWRSWWGVDVRQPGGPAGPVDHPGDRVPIKGGAVGSWEKQRMLGWHVLHAVLIDQHDQLWVQRQVAVVVQLAHGHVQPRCSADLHDRVGRQRGVLADP